MKNNIRTLRIAYWTGAVLDFFATVLLLKPEYSMFLFGIKEYTIDSRYLYVSRIAASLMFGWTILLIWADRKPVERRGIILITIIPVVLGLAMASVLVVRAGFIAPIKMLPLWILYAVLISSYLIIYYQTKSKK